MQKPIRPPSLLVLLCLGAGLLVACGGDDTTTAAGDPVENLTKEQYAEEVEEVLQPLNESLSALGDSLSQADDPATVAEEIGGAQADLKQVTTELATVEPPADVGQIHQDLIEAIDGFSTELDSVRKAAADDDLEALQTAARELPAVTQAFAAELDRVQSAAIGAGVPIEAPDGGDEG